MNNAIDAWRRWLGMLFLTLAAGMLIWGHTFLESYLKGIGFLIYWMVCFFFTIASIVIALLDVRAVLRNVRSERMALLRRAMKDIKDGAAKAHEEPVEIPAGRRSLASFEEVR
jgi:hypothetical protein